MAHAVDDEWTQNIIMIPQWKEKEEIHMNVSTTDFHLTIWQDLLMLILPRCPLIKSFVETLMCICFSHCPLILTLVKKFVYLFFTLSPSFLFVYLFFTLSLSFRVIFCVHQCFPSSLLSIGTDTFLLFRSVLGEPFQLSASSLVPFACVYVDAIILHRSLYR